MSDKKSAILLSAILLLGVLVWISQDIATGQFIRYDGYLTLDRSGGFEKFDDWLGVYSTNAPSARKPPLQYWFTALNLAAGMPELLALRLPSLVFFLGLLGATATLSYLMTGGNAWAAGAAIALLCCSWVLITHARSGMLDLGLSFFTMLAMLALYCTRRNANAWLLCGLAVGLGALQKAPAALLLITLLVLVLALRKDQPFRFSSLRRNGHFWLGLGTAVVLLLAWPTIQVIKMGPEFIEIAYTNEMLLRFNPVGESQVSSPTTQRLWLWIWEDTGLVSILGGLCILAVLGFQRWRSDKFLFGLALLAVVILASYALATGAIYQRYLALLTPFLVVVMVRVGSDLVPWRPAVFLGASVLVVLSGSRIHAAMAEINSENTYSAMRERVEILDSYRQPNDIVALDRTTIFPGAYGYFSHNTDRFGEYQFKSKMHLARFQRDFQQIRASGNSMIGIAKKKRVSKIKAITGKLETHKLEGGYMVWRYPGSSR